MSNLKSMMTACEIFYFWKMAILKNVSWLFATIGATKSCVEELLIHTKGHTEIHYTELPDLSGDTSRVINGGVKCNIKSQ